MLKLSSRNGLKKSSDFPWQNFFSVARLLFFGENEGDPHSPPQGEAARGGKPPLTPGFESFFFTRVVYPVLLHGASPDRCLHHFRDADLRRRKPSGGERAWPHRTFSPQFLTAFPCSVEILFWKHEAPFAPAQPRWVRGRIAIVNNYGLLSDSRKPSQVTIAKRGMPMRRGQKHEVLEPP